MSYKLFGPTTIAIAVTGLLVAGCTQSSTPSNTASQPESTLRWSACPDGVENPEEGPSRLQCATVPVPLDYENPDGTRIDITISRLPSENPDERRGVLLLNPGGPGGTGLDQPKFLESLGMPKSVLDSYDLIGMDTRGVGHSAPVSCGFSEDLEYYGAVPPYAVDEAAFTEQATTSKEVAERCAANDRDETLRHVTTANMARDLDRIRSALGEERASFLGFSYGTALGAAYASMFSDTSDRIVLDSNIGDTHLDRDGLRRYAQGMEGAFPDFAEWVAAENDQYGLGATAEDVRDTYFRIAEKLDGAPVDGINGRLFRLSTFATLYNSLSYEAAAESWQYFSTHVGGDPSVDSVVGNEAPAMDNNWSVFLAVTCNDVEWTKDVATYRQAVEDDRTTHPLFGAAAANIMPCAFWKSAPSERPVQIDGEGPANILIAQNRRDPVTPLAGGRLLDEKFGERSTLLTVDGSGHGVFVLGKNACAQDIVADYLVDGTMPSEDITCR
ncbi:alpha/beta hydrolase [Rhodococcus sp. IEGM 1401]|uniref:alpha/beta hydrolase n=1 Tax=unclassified Rhodococcus (in: high G+C Gram-positive bacteria) TaxID=192944 RepID=UPI0022B3B4A8|nr:MULTISPECIES: alpha/beta hydrolase [unclassified Rhodococcus (in: high G+C Gram-positive bacteria)]MCZ4562843.1 alpha/beta hydrolase [Rhodococcus sp. IEGM 1401]MDI9922966.1 alpha/beta hydrolase [Rhodococcus sp. IEGM 1372]MDV8035562.1 alpha/beta hydrolase [Rhodococcus sp. IEGM 1414]